MREQHQTKSGKGEVVELQMARVHPRYHGLTREQLGAALRADIADLSLEALAELSWAVAQAGLSSASKRSARSDR